MPVASLDNSRFPVSEHGQPVHCAGFAHLLAKRTLDVVAALVGMVILLPVYAVISVALLVVMGRPIFFRQIRAGLHNRPIRLLKFRTMTNDRDASGNLLPDTDAPYLLRPVPAALEPGRTASVVECPGRGSFARGTTSVADARCAAL